MKTINHIDDPKFGALNPDCPCDECTEIDWDAQCINCSLKARDCFGQDHYTPEERDQVICHNCLREELIPDEDTHRCLANPLSCHDGVDCPDYVENCECPECEGQNLNEDQNRCFDCEPYEVSN